METYKGKNVFDERGYINLKNCSSISKWLLSTGYFSSVECYRTDVFVIVNYLTKDNIHGLHKIRAHTVYLMQKSDFESLFQEVNKITNWIHREIWKHKEIPNIYLERSYEDDRVLIIDKNTGGRLVIADKKFSEISLDNWEPTE